MLRSVAITSALLLVAQAGVAVARTDGEPAAGCGSSEAYLRSGRLDDLPGCDGELPPGAVEASRAQRDGKLALMRVGRFLLDEDRAQTAAALERAEEAVARLEALGAVGGAAGQLPLFRRALSILVARAQLLPEADGLRACHALSQVQLKKGMATLPEVGAETAAPAPPTDLGQSRTQLTRAEECVALLRRLLSQKLVQEALGDGLVVEIAPGQLRRMPDLLVDVRAAHKVALFGHKEALAAWEIIKGRWLRVLFSDRLRIFQAHPEELPEYDGKARGPLPASVLPRWRYRTKDGKIETFLFKRHRLISRTVEDPRRS